MRWHLHLLMTDWFIWSLFILAVAAVIYMRRFPHLRAPWQQVLRNRIGMVAFTILSFYALIGLLDSIHFQAQSSQKQQVMYNVRSLLDLMLSPLGQQDEQTYSRPFARTLYEKRLIQRADGSEYRGYPPLRHVSASVLAGQSRTQDIMQRIGWGILVAAICLALVCYLLVFILARRYALGQRALWRRLWKGELNIAWREWLVTFSLVWMVLILLVSLATGYHVLGTDKIGKDILYEAIKSIRTGLLIGTLTTIFMLPFAIVLGTLAGYFRGWVDDVIQYLYTTLSSIPGVLLISASILVLQIYIANHPARFPTLLQRADARLLPPLSFPNQIHPQGLASPLSSPEKQYHQPP